VEDFGWPDNLMMIHALDLHGCPLVTPRASTRRHLARSCFVRGLRPPRGRSRDQQIELKLTKKSDSEPPSRKRADILLVERGLFESRARARAAIEAGGVVADGKRVAKASDIVAADAALSAQPAHPYVSRGGVKLAGALDNTRSISRAMSASTSAHRPAASPNAAGQCASLVFSIDVGHGQCIPRCTPSPDRLHGRDRRSLVRGQAAAGAGRTLSSSTVSFISLKAVLPVALSLAAAADESSGADQAAIRGAAV